MIRDLKRRELKRRIGKMDIVESDLKKLFMWVIDLQELCKSQNALIEQHQDAIESLEERIINIETSWNPVTQEENK